jgi:flagellar assembly protein FliH
MATIIKSNSPQYPSGTALRSVAYQLSDMDDQADSYIQRVRGEAMQIIQQARTEAEVLRSEAQQAGRAAAEAAVEQVLDQKVAQQMATLLPALKSAVQKVEDAKQDWLRHWETAAIDLALQIARRVIHRELANRPEISQEWLREALQLAAGSSDVVIRLSPKDAETVGRAAEDLAAVFTPTARARVVADDTISPGGCRVETEFGSVDQQLETQLARIAEELQ